MNKLLAQDWPPRMPAAHAQCPHTTQNTHHYNTCCACAQCLRLRPRAGLLGRVDRDEPVRNIHRHPSQHSQQQSQQRSQPSNSRSQQCQHQQIHRPQHSQPRLASLGPHPRQPRSSTATSSSSSSSPSAAATAAPSSAAFAFAASCACTIRSTHHFVPLIENYLYVRSTNPPLPSRRLSSCRTHPPFTVSSSSTSTTVGSTRIRSRACMHHSHAHTMSCIASAHRELHVRTLHQPSASVSPPDIMPHPPSVTTSPPNSTPHSSDAMPLSDDPSLYSLLSTLLFDTALRHPVALLVPLDVVLRRALPRPGAPVAHLAHRRSTADVTHERVAGGRWAPSARSSRLGEKSGRSPWEWWPAGSFTATCPPGQFCAMTPLAVPIRSHGSHNKSPVLAL